MKKNDLFKLVKNVRRNGWGYAALPKEFKYIFGAHTLKFLLDNYDFSSVLDIGSGAGKHSQIFKDYGKNVTKVDYGSSVYFEENKSQEDIIHGDFNEVPIDETYDCVWACHVFEHQPNPQLFLEKMIKCTRQDGIIAIVIPPFRKRLVGGHINLGTLAILIYRLVLAGIDCSHAKMFRNGYNLGLIVRKSQIHLPDGLTYDSGDVRLLREFFPQDMHEGRNHW